MRYPKEFKQSGNYHYLNGYPVAILQWNTGKNKNFLVERYVKPFAEVTIPGRGDEAMERAIEKAYELAKL